MLEDKTNDLSNLGELINKKNNSIDSYIWKGRKTLSNGEYTQNEVKMVDCSVEELKSFLTHCKSMLYNEDVDNPGRYVLLNIIKEQRDKCNTELFIRWLEQDKETPRYVFLSSLRDFLNNNPSINPKETPIKIAVGGCPKEFENLLIDMVLNGCLDTLGKINKKHITLTFLLKQGLWFSPEETKKMSKENVSDKLEYAKGQLDIKSSSNLRISPKGLSLAQLQAMISLRSRKYSELSNLQLETLRNRILFSLENEIMFHISQWETRIKQIVKVLESKGVNDVTI